MRDESQKANERENSRLNLIFCIAKFVERKDGKPEKKNIYI
jgi:hypothetical protein